MTKFTSEELTTLDLDWFAIDSTGIVGHFTSSGTIAVPTSVSASKERLEEIYQWMYRRPREVDQHAFCESAKKYSAWLRQGSAEQTFAYYEAYAEWADRGMYSFNIGNKGGWPSTPYFLVAKPMQPLHESEIPEPIWGLLRETRIDISFEETTSIAIPFDANI